MSDLRPKLLSILERMTQTAKKSENKNTYFIYLRALRSLRQNKEPIEDVQQILTLKYFGPAIFQRIMAELLKEDILTDSVVEQADATVEKMQVQLAKKQRRAVSGRTGSIEKIGKPYIPPTGSTNEAILRALYLLADKKGCSKEQLVELCSHQSLGSKSQLQEMIEQHLEVLVGKGLIEKLTKTKHWCLGEKGQELADYLFLDVMDTARLDLTATAGSAVNVVGVETIKEKSQGDINHQIREIEKRLLEEQVDLGSITIMPPVAYRVILILDHRELTLPSIQMTNKKKNPGTSYLVHLRRELEYLGVEVQVRQLELGDCLWVAHPISNDEGSFGSEYMEEIVLDVIVERKTNSDLIHSIKDGRYSEQKQRLERCGLEKVIYLVEGGGDDNNSTDTFQQAILSAQASVQMSSGFFLKRSDNLSKTAAYLARLTNWLNQHKILLLGLGSSVDLDAWLAQRDRLKQSIPVKILPTYQTFAKLNAKSAGICSVGDITQSLYTALPGVSVEKANTLTKAYPTIKRYFQSEAYFDARGGRLWQAYEECKDEKGRKELLINETAKVLLTRRKINAALSERIYQNLYKTDEAFL